MEQSVMASGIAYVFLRGGELMIGHEQLCLLIMGAPLGIDNYRPYT